MIVKRRIDKMRNKVDHIKSEIEKDELNLVKEIDINKVINKSSQNTNASSVGSAKSKV